MAHSTSFVLFSGSFKLEGFTRNSSKTILDFCIFIEIATFVQILYQIYGLTIFSSILESRDIIFSLNSSYNSLVASHHSLK